MAAARRARTARYYRPGRRSRIGCAALTALVLLGAAIATVVLLLKSTDRTGASNICTAEAGDTAWELSVDQADNAALIAVTATSRGMPARAATIGLATALQESRLINIDYGDRDSIGLFQQRPSQGWGTIEQIMDPVYSTGKFYDGLAGIDGYTEMEVTEAAQAVQRSGFPDAYAQHEPRSRAWASALTGWSEASLNCDLDPASEPGSPTAMAARAQRDFGGAVTATVDGSGDGTRVLLDSEDLAFIAGGEQPRIAWGVAQWAVAVAADQQITRVWVADSEWEREAGGWRVVDDVEQSLPELADGQVVVTLATAD